MKKYFFDIEKKHILTIATMNLIELNETSSLIIKELLKNKTEKEVTQLIYNSLDKEYQISNIYNEIQNDIDILIKDLLTKGIDVSKPELFNIIESDNKFKSVPDLPIVHIIKNCNSLCTICDCWKDNNNNYHPYEILRDIFQELIDKGMSTIMISGGEPLLHPQLEEIIDFLKNQKIEIQLNTNGMLLNKISWLTKKNIEHIIISIDGTDSDSYKKIRGVDFFTKIFSEIKEFKKISPQTKIGIRTIFSKYFLKNYKEFISICKNSKIDSIDFSPLDISSSSFSRTDNNSDNINELKSLLPTLGELQDYISSFTNKDAEIYKYFIKEFNNGYLGWEPKKIIECLNFYKNELSNPDDYQLGEDICLFPYTSLLIDYDGSIKNCFYSNPIGNIYDKKNIDWDTSSAIEELKANNICSKCRGKIFST